MSASVAETIVTLEEVHYVAITTGAYDVFISVGPKLAEALGLLEHPGRDN